MNAREPREPPQLAGYTLHRRIGRGAYGEVWLARDAMGAWRAVKFVFRDQFDSARPFEREFAGLQRYASLSRGHDSQVSILQLHREDTWFCYVMELADDRCTGQEIDPARYEPRTLLSDLEKAGRLPARDCLTAGVALATALVHLHRHGLVHRDVKPANVVFVHGQPKLADIGLVAVVDETTSFVGTEGYVPPEGPGTQQADVFSLGRVLYQLSTGLPQARFPEIPARLEAGEDAVLARELNLIILKACAPETARRHAGAAALREELVLLQSGRSIQRIRDAERRAIFFRKIGLAAAAVALVALVGVGAAWRSERGADQARVDAETQRQRAEASERARTGELIRASMANAQRLLAAGDSFRALPWLVEALELETDPQQAEAHRARIASVLAYSPRMIGAFFHEGAVNRIAMSPDGARVLTAGQDGTARVWPLDGSAQPLVLNHSSEVHWAEWDATGSWIVTACNDGAARLWDAGSGERIGPEFRHDGAVLCARINADGSAVASGGTDNVFRLWDAATGAPRLTVKMDNDVRAIDFSPDGRLVAAAASGNGCTLSVWHVADGTPVVEKLGGIRWVTELAFHPSGRYVGAAGWAMAGAFEIESGRITARNNTREVMLCFQWNHDGSRFASGGNERQATVTRFGANAERLAFLEHDQPVTAARFSPDGAKVVTVSQDGTARVWNPGNGAPLSPPLRHSGRVTSAEFTQDGSRLVTAGIDGMVRIWELAQSSTQPAELPHDSRIRSARFTRNGQTVALARDSGGVYLYDLATGKSTRPPLPVPPWPLDARFSPDERELVTVHRGKATVWDLQTGKAVRPAIDAGGQLITAAFTRDGREIVTLGATDLVSHYRNQRVHVEQGPVTFRRWDAPSGTPIAEPVSSGEGAWFATLDDAATHVAVAFDRPAHAFQTWDVAAGRPLTPRIPLDARVWHLEFSPDGSRLVTATAQAPGMGGAGVARIWDARTGAAVSAPMLHEHDIFFAAFSADGTRVVTASEDATARVWDASTGAPLTGPMRSQWKVVHASFSADARRVVTASGDHSARVWDVATGELLAPPIWHPGRVFWAWCNSDGRSVISATENGMCRVWRIPSTTEAVAALREDASLYASERRHPRFGMVPLTPAELRQIWETRGGANGMTIPKVAEASAPPDSNLRYEPHN